MKLLISLLVIASLSCHAQESDQKIFNYLVQREQQLVDAIAVGDRPIWIKALHDSCIITIENGTALTKKKLIEQLDPLPEAYKGEIKIIQPKLKVYSNTAVLTFINDEYLELYGQKIHTQYRQTDTWLRMGEEWKVIAMQLFEILKNPPPVNISQSILTEYVGSYALGSDRKCIVTVDKGKLFSKKNDKEPVELLAETENVFFRNGDGRVRIFFVKNQEDNSYKMIERRAGEDVVWKQIK